MPIKIKNEITPAAQGFFNLNAIQLETIAQMAVENMIEGTFDMIRDEAEEYTTFQSVKVTIDGSKDMAKDMLNDHLSWIKQCIFDYIDNIQIDMKRVSCDGKGFTDADVEIK